MKFMFVCVIFLSEREQIGVAQCRVLVQPSVYIIDE